MTFTCLAVALLQLVLGWQGRRARLLRDFNWRLWAVLSTALLLAVGAAGLVVAHTFVDPERDAAAILVTAGLAASCLGFAAAAVGRGLPGREVLGALLPAWQVAAFFIVLLPRTTEVLPQAFRALVIFPAVYIVCACFGMSLGYLRRDGFFSRAFFFEAMLARRFLLSKASHTLSVVTAICIVGVTLGVWLVLVALGILSGFEHDLQRKIIGSNAHIVAQTHYGRPFGLAARQQQALCQAPGIAACAPYIQGEVAVASPAQYTGAVIFGIDPEQAAGVLSVLQQIVAGSLTPLAKASAAATAPRAAGPPGLAIGKQMARNLDVKVGDTLRLISATQEVLTPLGPTPKSRTFEVVAIFASDMYEYDARFAYVAMPVARAFFGFAPDQFSGVQLKVSHLPALDAAKRALTAAAHQVDVAGLTLLDWRQRNQTLFAALRLERGVAFVVLVFIILVASFSIVNTLTMSIIEKRREIAILKTMGATDASIVKIFLITGLVIGGFGIGLGATLGIGSMLLLQRFGFWIPGDVYYIDSLPVNLNASDICVVVTAATLIVWDFAVFPSWEGSRLAPVEGLRDG